MVFIYQMDERNIFMFFAANIRYFFELLHNFFQKIFRFIFVCNI